MNVIIYVRPASRWHLHQWRMRMVIDSTYPLLYGHTIRQCTVCGKSKRY